MPMTFKLRTCLVPVLCLAFAVVGCNRDEEVAVQEPATLPAPTAQMSTVRVTDVELGKGIDAQKMVTNGTDEFAASDEIYASVHTQGTASNATLGARWTYQDGQVVNEESKTISPSGEERTEFHISKDTAWPAGTYTLHVLLDGNEVQSKQFTVQ
ncbi:hypothetical protein BH23GEM4_BH23GEM4_12110 [soil metagenome]